MKYIQALSLAASVASANMHVMSLAPQAAEGPMTHTVRVGGLKPVETGMAPILGYAPEAITANVGDVVLFEFYQKNHTVTQSTFAEPCKKMDGGMDSGFMPNPDGKAGVTWNMTVPNTEALWFYCKQQNGIHCGKGMVFSINAKFEGDKTMAQFKNLAIQKNGTGELAAIQQVDPAAAAAPSTVTVHAQGGGSAVATATHTGAAGAGGAGAAAGTATGTGAALATASVVAGQGTDTNGQACSCHCLCGVNDFPAQAAVNNFGGFAGMISS